MAKGLSDIERNLVPIDAERIREVTSSFFKGEFRHRRHSATFTEACADCVSSLTCTGRGGQGIPIPARVC